MIKQADLLRLIEGDCSPDEAAAIQRWVVADPRRVELLDDLRCVWHLTGDTTRHWDAAAARERLLEARNRKPRAGGPFPERRRALRRTRPMWPVLMRIAAVLVVAIAGAVLWRTRVPVTAREYATARGQRAELTFSDGTRVLLGVASRIRVPPDYGVRERGVELEGQAYFDVRHDPRRPFRVRTRQGTTEDLGTAFDVRAYGDEQYLQVVVATGRVVVRGAGTTTAVALTLRPRDRAVIDARGNATTTSGVQLSQYLAWTRGALVFHDAPVALAVAQLNRWYDLDIQITDRSLDGERLTIAFTTQSADEALGALAQVLDVRIARADRVVRLIPVHRRRT